MVVYRASRVFREGLVPSALNICLQVGSNRELGIRCSELLEKLTDEHQFLLRARYYFRPVMRGISVFLLLHFIMVLLAPAWIVVDFMVERDHIERELCVQRMVPDAQRTCHGECCLMKRLQKSGDRERNLPMELRSIRLGDMIIDDGDLVLIGSLVCDKPVWGKLKEEVREGHPRPHAPVPWC